MSDKTATRNQERARAAYTKVDNVKDESWGMDYGRQCLRLPALIQQCGLCQAIAFYQSKAGRKDNDQEKEKGRVYFSRLLSDLGEIARIDSDVDRFADKIRNASVPEYVWMTREVIACANWLKRYSEAVLKVKPGEEGDRE